MSPGAWMLRLRESFSDFACQEGQNLSLCGIFQNSGGWQHENAGRETYPKRRIAMNIQQEIWLRQQWNAFKEIYGYFPTEDQWNLHIKENLANSENPLSHVMQGERVDCIHRALQSFRVQEVVDDEISIKVRDAKANLNNRRYVDGTF
jgi:hypothetical protein